MGKGLLRSQVHSDSPTLSKSQEGAVAWKLVEALPAEAARQKVEKLPLTAFEEYYQEYPEAMEARRLERWCSG